LKKAYAEEKRWPSSVYGKAHIMRASKGGAADVLENYGASAKLATVQQLANRRHTGWTGRGAYNLAKAYQQSGLGKFVSPILRAGSNRAVGMISGSGLYSGRGEYTTNNLVSGGEDNFMAAEPATMSSAADETGAVTITHREYLQDVYAPGVAGQPAVAFLNQEYALNPGLQSTFSFLSQIAQNFDEYEFIQLLFHYRSTTTDIGNSTTGQCGTVIMTTNYNAAAPMFADKQSMIEYAHSHSVKVTENMTHGVECDPHKTALSSRLYVRSTPVVAGQDIKTYDHGLFQLAIANCPAAYNGFPIGELWCEYTVTLRKPKIFTSRGLDIDQDTFVAAGGNGALCNTSTATNPLGIPPAPATVWSNLRTSFVGQQNSIGCQLAIANCLSSCAVVAYAIGATPFYGYVNGSAMTAVAINGNLQNGQIQITFPAYYTSNIAIRIQFAGPAPGTTTTMNGQIAVQTSGNIVGVADMYAAGLLAGTVAPSSVCVTPGVCPVGVGQLAQQQYNIEIHCFVKGATSGVNNAITVQLDAANFLALGGGGIGSVVVEQYQAQGIFNAPPVAINGVVPPVFIANTGVVSKP